MIRDGVGASMDEGHVPTPPLMIVLPLWRGDATLPNMEAANAGLGSMALATTSARLRLTIVSPELVDAHDTGWDDVRCLRQQLILLGRAISQLDVAVE